MFVAYTGYGRIATLGEEVRSPRTTIPRHHRDADRQHDPVCQRCRRRRGRSRGRPVRRADTGDFRAAGSHRCRLWRRAPAILAAGAITAMLGVLLNLLLGLSRAVLAMGRRRDLPAAVARVSETSKTPEAAVIVVAVLIAALVLIGDVRIYLVVQRAYRAGLLRHHQPGRAADAGEQRLFPRGVAMAGLLCLSFSRLLGGAWHLDQRL